MKSNNKKNQIIENIYIPLFLALKESKFLLKLLYTGD
jgi:hypothetical protein